VRVCVSMRVNVFACICMHVCIHVYMCMHARECICVYCMCMHVCVCMYVCACMYACVYVYMCVSMCMYACVYVCMCAMAAVPLSSKPSLQLNIATLLCRGSRFIYSQTIIRCTLSLRAWYMCVPPSLPSLPTTDHCRQCTLSLLGCNCRYEKPRSK